MNIRPLHDRIVVRRKESQHLTAAGIVIPDTAAEKPERGTVIAVGEGKWLNDGSLRKLAVRAGDEILFGKHAGNAIKVHDEEVLVMRESDVLGVIESPDRKEG